MKVWLIVFTHKHGQDFSVAKTERVAVTLAASWAREDACDHDQGDEYGDLISPLSDTASAEDQLNHDKRFLGKFEEIGMDVYGHSRIEIEETEVIE